MSGATEPGRILERIGWFEVGAVGMFLIAVAIPQMYGTYTVFLAASIIALSLYALSYDLLYGYAGILSFAHAIFFGTGAYVAALLIQDAGVGVFLAMGAGAVVALLMSAVVGVVVVRIPNVNGLIIVTIILTVIAHLIANTWTEVTGGSDGIAVLVPETTLPVLGTLSFLDGATIYYFVLAVTVVSFVVLYKLVNSPVGLAFKMIRENEERAKMLGYNVLAYKLGAFTVSGFFAGLAGVLSMYISGFVSASKFTITTTADPVIYTLIGGKGTLLGPIFGSVLINLGGEQLSDFTNAYPLFVGLLLVVVALAGPSGLIGVARRTWQRLRAVLETQPTDSLPDAPEEDPGGNQDS